MKKSIRTFANEVANYLALKRKPGFYLFKNDRLLHELIKEGSILGNKTQMDILYEHYRWYEIALVMETNLGVARISESEVALIGDFTLGDAFNAFVANDVRLVKKTISKSEHHLNVVVGCFSIFHSRGKTGIPKKVPQLVIDEFCKKDNLKLNQESLYFILEKRLTKDAKQKIFGSSVFRSSKTVQRKCIDKCPHIMKGMTLDEVRSVFTLTGSEFLRVFHRNKGKKIVVPSGFMSWAQKDIMVGKMGKKGGYINIPQTYSNVVEM